MSIQKRYQVFVSSTYADLKDQRRDIFEALWKNDCIPVGMEGFVVGHMDQWDYIKDRIDESDYFVVVVAHRYGSKFSELGPISITEAEYDYAVSKGIPISRFVIDPGFPWSGTSDHRSEGQDKKNLDAFKARLKRQNGKHYDVSYWGTNLKENVIHSVNFMIKNKPRNGIVRCNDGMVDLDIQKIDRVYTTTRNHDKIKLLSSDNEFIDIVLNDGYNFFRKHMLQLKDALSSDVPLRIMLLHPNNKLLDIIANKSVKSFEQQCKELSDTILFLRKELSHFRKFQLFGHMACNSYAAIIGSKSCLVDFYFNFHPPGRRQEERIAVECNASGDMTSLYWRIRDDFENLWRETESQGGSDLLSSDVG
jgi:hypothetical protein